MPDRKQLQDPETGSVKPQLGGESQDIDALIERRLMGARERAKDKANWWRAATLHDIQAALDGFLALCAENKALKEELDAALSGERGMKELLHKVEGERDDLADRVEELERDAEIVSEEFEKDCWAAVRWLLENVGHTDFQEGVTAQDACEIIWEAIRETRRRAETAERERDEWKQVAEQHFGHMRTAIGLSYALQYLFDPEFLERIAEAIDCGGECETAWRDHDTNASGCSRQDTNGCPFDDAVQLRDMAKAIRTQAWTLAFSPPSPLQAAQADLARKEEALRPFARVIVPDSLDDAAVIACEHITRGPGSFTAGDLRRARLAIQPQEGKDA